MKKTLVAIAALSTVSAFAQVTLSGNMDFAGAKVGGSQLWAMGSTFSQTVGTMSTSVINITAVDDIGGGTKVTAHYGLDPRLLANDSLAVTNNTGAVSTFGGQLLAISGRADLSTGTSVAASATANSIMGTVGGQANTATGLGRDEMFVGAAGSFGNIRLGAPNSIGLNTFQNGSPAGTGIGGGYTGGGTAGTMTNSFVQTRYNRSARYDSPVMSGFTVSAMYAPGNSQTAATTGIIVTGSTGAATPVLPIAFLIPNARAASEFGIKYANGPLTVMYANITQDIQLASTGWYATGSNTKGIKTSANFVTASYALGDTTFYVGANDGQRLAPIGSAGADATANVDSKGKRFAVKQVMGNINLMASLTTQDALGVTAISTTAASTTAANITASTLKAKVLGFRGEYNLSKTSTVYAGYEKYETGATYDASAPTSTGNRTITSMGLKSSF